VIAIIQPFIITKWPPLSPRIIACHKDSTPANIEDLSALLYEMRENQDEHYRKTDKRLAHLEGDHDVPLHQTVRGVSTRSRTTQTRGASTIARKRRGRVSTGANNDSELRAGQFNLDAENVVVARGKHSVAGREVQGGLEVSFRSRLLIRN
jgi:hypothetical protein